MEKQASPEADLVNWSLRIFQLKKKSVQLKLLLHLIILNCVLSKNYSERWDINLLQLSKKTFFSPEACCSSASSEVLLNRSTDISTCRR